MKDFEEFKQIRENQGFTQIEFAEILGISRSTVAKIEAGNHKITPKLLEKVIAEFPGEVNVLKKNYLTQRENHIKKGVISTKNNLLGEYLGITVNKQPLKQLTDDDLFFSDEDKKIFEKLMTKNEELINLLDRIQDVCEIGMRYDKGFYDKNDVNYINETRVKISLSIYLKILSNKHEIKVNSERLLNELDINLSVSYKILFNCIQRLKKVVENS